MQEIANLRKLSARLRRTGSEVLNAPVELVQARLRRLIRLVDEEPLLKRAIGATHPPDEDPLKLLAACRDSGTRLRIPEDELAHVGLLHRLLTRLSDDDVVEEVANGAFWRLCFNYGYVRNMEESVREVLDDTVRPYVGYLEQVVSNELIDATEAAGQPRSVSLTIQGSPNTMVNVAGDASTIQAQQQQEVEKGAAEVLQLAREVIELLGHHRDLPTEKHEELRELASEVTAEVVKDSPSQGRLARLNDRLQEYVQTIEGAKDLALQIRALMIALAKFGAVVGLGHHLPS